MQRMEEDLTRQVSPLNRHGGREDTNGRSKHQRFTGPVTANRIVFIGGLQFILDPGSDFYVGILSNRWEGNLSSRTFEAIRIGIFRFEDATANALNLKDAVIGIADLNRGVFQHSNFCAVTIQGGGINKMEFGKTTFRSAQLNNLAIKDVRLQDVSFRYAQLTNVRFENCSFDHVSFREATLTSVTFCNMSLSNTSFDSAIFCRVTFAGVDQATATFNNTIFDHQMKSEQRTEDREKHSQHIIPTSDPCYTTPKTFSGLSQIPNAIDTPIARSGVAVKEEPTVMLGWGNLPYTVVEPSLTNAAMPKIKSESVDTETPIPKGLPNSAKVVIKEEVVE